MLVNSVVERVWVIRITICTTNDLIMMMIIIIIMIV